MALLRCDMSQKPQAAGQADSLSAGFNAPGYTDNSLKAIAVESGGGQVEKRSLMLRPHGSEVQTVSSLLIGTPTVRTHCSIERPCRGRRAARGSIECLHPNGSDLNCVIPLPGWLCRSHPSQPQPQPPLVVRLLIHGHETNLQTSCSLWFYCELGHCPSEDWKVIGKRANRFRSRLDQKTP